MRKILSLLLAVWAFVVLGLPAQATLTNSNTHTTRTSGASSVDFYTALITAASNDTTANADSNTISNLDGTVKDLSAGVVATNQTGTSPTLTVTFIGSYDNATWFVLQSKQGSTAGTTAAMSSSALSISSASSTNVSTGISTDMFGRTTGLPPYLRVRITVGGTGTPGWTGVAYAIVKR